MDSANIRLILTKDGSHSLYHEELGETYHSRNGALSESQHVFRDHGLDYMARMYDKIRILEFGFGTGLNASLSLMYATEHSEVDIEYTGVEAFPVSTEIVESLNYAEFLDFPGFDQLHSLQWDRDHQILPNFRFRKNLMAFDDIRFVNEFNLVFFDVFAPKYQPQFWEAPFLSKVAACMTPSAALVTYCAKGSFQRVLKALGLEVEKLPGPPGKREMIRATKG